MLLLVVFLLLLATINEPEYQPFYAADPKIPVGFVAIPHLSFEDWKALGKQVDPQAKDEDLQKYFDKVAVGGTESKLIDYDEYQDLTKTVKAEKELRERF